MYTSLAAAGSPSRAARARPSASAASRWAAGWASPARALGTTSDNIASLRIVTADGKTRTCDARHERRPLLGLPGRRRRELRRRHQLHLHDPRRSARPPTSSATYAWATAGDVVAALAALGARTRRRAVLALLARAPARAAPRSASSASTWARRRPCRRTLTGLTSAVQPRNLPVGSSRYLDLILRWAGCLDESPAACRMPPLRARSSGQVQLRAPAAGGAGGSRPWPRWIERRQAQNAGSGFDPPRLLRRRDQRVAPDATAFVHRDALYSCQYRRLLERRRAVDRAVVDLELLPGDEPVRVRLRVPELHRPGPGQLEGTPTTAPTTRRLVDVKRRVDPDDLFRFRQSIPVEP